MQILITGGSGSVGRAVVRRLINSGHRVRVIGRRAEAAFEGAEYLSCDINDYSCLREAVRGCEALVHLAAIASPAAGTPEELFRVNCAGTFNVFQAAAEEGIRRVVQASSINAAGQYYGVKPAPLHYLPLDEAHPSFTTDAYSFSKEVVESIGDYFWRREGITSLSLRLPWVAPQAQHEKIEPNRERVSRLVDKLLQKDTSERLAWFDRMWSSYNEFRAQGGLETRGLWKQLVDAQPDDVKEGWMAMGYRVNFFTMIDERDSAQAVEKGLTADLQGSHPLFINDSLNWTGIESRLLAELFYPDVPALSDSLQGTDSLVRIDRARLLIGFEPEFSFGR